MDGVDIAEAETPALDRDKAEAGEFGGGVTDGALGEGEVGGHCLLGWPGVRALTGAFEDVEEDEFGIGREGIAAA